MGVGLLGALFLWGRIDLRALSGLADAPWTVAACTLLVFLLLPLGALRWGLLLRALDISIPFAKLFHFVSIGMVMNMFLLGSVGGDAARGLYAWRAVGDGSARIAISLVADRLLGLLALLSIALLFTAFNWHWMRHIPALAALGVALFLIVRRSHRRRLCGLLRFTLDVGGRGASVASAASWPGSLAARATWSCWSARARGTCWRPLRCRS